MSSLFSHPSWYVHYFLPASALAQAADYDRAHHELCRVFESKLTALQTEFTQQQAKAAASSHEQAGRLTRECDQVCADVMHGSRLLFERACGFQNVFEVQLGSIVC